MARLGSRGQASSEYLVILAAVFLIVLAGIGLYTYVAGTLEDQRLQQSKLYWSRQRPIAIVDGAATMNGKAGEGDNLVVLTLKNMGEYPVELLAIRQQPTGKHGSLNSTAYGSLSPEFGYKYLSPDASAYGDYIAYVAPPKGSGYGKTSSRITLKEGEEVTIGFGVLANSGGGATYSPIAFCRDTATGSLGKTMEFGVMDLFLVERIGNQSIVKHEIGDVRLVLPCVANYTPF